MSLDVYLTRATSASAEPLVARTGALDMGQAQPAARIYVRRDGGTVEISREQWDRENPGREPVVFDDDEDDRGCVYSATVTHNLGTMAEAAGVYRHLWRPDELGITHARELIAPLREGLERLLADPATYERHNPANGWGSYSGLCRFVQKYAEACEQWPDATVSVSR